MSQGGGALSAVAEQHTEGEQQKQEEDTKNTEDATSTDTQQQTQQEVMTSSQPDDVTGRGAPSVKSLAREPSELGSILEEPENEK